LAVHPLPPLSGPADDRGAARRALGVPDGTTAVLYLGLIRPYKGVDVLLDAVASLPREAPLVLLLAGEPWGGERARIARRLADPRLAGRVVARLAWLPEKEVPLWLAAADVAVLPYRSATGSAVAAQALGAGLPVVATRVGGLVDVVEDGVSGLLVDPGDSAALAEALLRVGDPVLRARLSDGARARALTWTWSSYAAALSALAAEVVSHRSAGATVQSS
jgi:glycosyltransferase involved in cell wall biosynthesis